MKRLLALGVVAILGFATLAYAQVIQTTITGSEVWVVGQGPGGPGAYIGIDTVRGSEPITTKSGSGAATSTATPGTLCWVGTAPTTWAVTFPAAPANGTIVTLCTDTTLTSMVTTTAGTGDTMRAALSSSTLTADTSFPAWQYATSTKVWYKVQ